MDRPAGDDGRGGARSPDRHERRAFATDGGSSGARSVDREDPKADDARFRRLPRAFRLKKQRLIRPLFERSRDDVGKVARGSVLLLYRIVPRDEVGADVPIQIGFAPGRIAKAVRRNRIKRILREVYRVSQDDLIGLFSDTERTLTMMILYRGDATAADDAIRRDLAGALDAAAEQLRAVRAR